MFEQFTDRSRRVVVLAQEEARLLNHNYIGTEHILLGLIHEDEGVAAKVLKSFGISLEVIREEVQAIIGQGGASPSGHIPFTPLAKKVLELSLREALQLGHNYIGTEHILLGLIREGEGVAAKVLERKGLELSTVRARVIEIIKPATKQQDPLDPIVEKLRASTPPAPAAVSGPKCPSCHTSLTGLSATRIEVTDFPALLIYACPGCNAIIHTQADGGDRL